MKRILFSLLILFTAANLSAQISVFEYKDEKSYCTLEFDSNVAQDTALVKGVYRAYQFYDIPYFEMTFIAYGYTSETGEQMIGITPDFYYHSFRAKLIGQRETMSYKQHHFNFSWIGDIITNITTEENRIKIFKKSVYAEKKDLDFTKFPESFTKVKSINWGKLPKDLRKTLQDKDKTLGRKY